jgi:RimJ/RimL family protein N-acetyltransferase
MIKFRPIERDDLDLLRDWRNDPEIRLFCREYRMLNLERQEKWFDSLTADTACEMYGIISDQRHYLGVAVCPLCDYQWLAIIPVGGNLIEIECPSCGENHGKMDADSTQEIDGQLIGVCGWTFIDWRSRHAMLSYYIGEKEHRSEETELTVLSELHRIAFNELNIAVCRAEIYDFDPRLPVIKKAGYVETGRRVKQYFHDGDYRDIIILSLNVKDWKNGSSDIHICDDH